ncbi:cytochrome b/b6 domain-containing protein [Sporomusa acidovorans]|uniref:Cytochrome b561 bacterial/Ni-hydrogenase domain-containing protein n=1 Tax=Sporomusa acidovorans (strain ATCC 49682 / DSM 3132 / Mol) TaxID=1123286 RepID=A0ABZ3J7L0_SPOA4|nr:cytochrome b/b6 domain-containing protein [Sporomusa acidovorans]OZC23468.1 formate dehydrogenase-N subunit gamma [Sporomusa acidovorans DSM 3132]SDF27790.1 formate dehydrogenase subunit gamma [Sporomusa acidovorans]
MSHHDEHGPRVLKHPFISRLFHWGLILGFLPAALTGFFIWWKPFSDDLQNLIMQIHIIGASILTLSCIFYIIFALDRIVAFTRRIFTWDARDMAWMKICGGYPQKMLLGKTIPVPPMGKINSGQKQMGIMMLIGGIILIVTGWGLYAFLPVAPKAVMYWFDMFHLVIGIFLGLCLFAHIFLGVYNWGEFLCMFGDGTQPLHEAEHHNPVWVENEIEPVKGSKISTPGQHPAG